MILTLDIDATDLGFVQLMHEMDIVCSAKNISPIEIWISFYRILGNVCNCISLEIQQEIKKLIRIVGEPSNLQRCYQYGFDCGRADGLYHGTIDYFRAINMLSEIKDNGMKYKFYANIIAASEYNPNFGKPKVPPKGIYSYIDPVDYSFMESWEFAELRHIPQKITDYIASACDYSGDKFEYFRLGFLCGLRKKYYPQSMTRDFYVDLPDFITTLKAQEIRRSIKRAKCYVGLPIPNATIPRISSTKPEFIVDFIHLGVRIDFNNHDNKTFTVFVLTNTAAFLAMALDKYYGRGYVYYSSEPSAMNTWLYQCMNI